MRKRLISLLAICCLGVILVGCGDKKDVDKNSGANSNSTLNADTEDSNNDSTNDNKDTPNEEVKDKEVSLSIYSADVNTFDLTKLGSLKVNENEDLKSRLDKLAVELSNNAFDSLPIKVQKIETINGKKVAVVDLEESEANKNITDPTAFSGPNWISSKFQGSTGGSITTKSLIETFLQRDYKGNWIDGVKFTYMGKPIEFDHVSSLSSVSYR